MIKINIKNQWFNFQGKVIWMFKKKLIIIIMIWNKITIILITIIQTRQTSNIYHNSPKN